MGVNKLNTLNSNLKAFILPPTLYKMTPRVIDMRQIIRTKLEEKEKKNQIPIQKLNQLLDLNETIAITTRAD